MLPHLYELVDTCTRHGEGLAYDQLLLQPRCSKILPPETDVTGQFSRNITLKSPLVSAAMTSVTETDMAIAMALNGGMGVMHGVLEPKEQQRRVRRVKLRLNGLVETPITVRPDMTIGEVRQMRSEKGYSFETFPVLDEHGRLTGIITSNDFVFSRDPSTLISKAMTPFEKIVYGNPQTKPADADILMCTNRVRVLPLIDDDRKLAGMYILSDVARGLEPRINYTLDQRGRLRVAASIGVLDNAFRRAELLAKVGCDAFVVGTAHGDSTRVLDTIRELKRMYPEIDIVAGNTSYEEGARNIAAAGADGILVGQGPGSICTTRIVCRVGIPQATAVRECSRVADEFKIPVIADGGIENSGHVALAFALGAQCVMLGKLLAGTDEAPGKTILYNGQTMKEHWGMGSNRAMREFAAADRYGQQDVPSGKRKSEGVDDGLVPYSGPVEAVVEDILGGVRNAMGYLDAPIITAIRNPRGVKIDAEGLRESRPHGIFIGGQHQYL